MDYYDAIIISIILGVFVVGLLAFLFFYWLFKSPFDFPYLIIPFDVSRKRNPKIEDYIDRYLIDNGLESFYIHIDNVEKWKQNCECQIENIKLKRLKRKRRKQFEESIDDKQMFGFKFTRNRTAYRQRNYVRTPYQISVTVERKWVGIDYLENRYKELSDIDFECPLSEYEIKNQRKLLTQQLKEEIAVRDNYTCQLCGRKMPDGFGMQIDHIIPISKGGKTVRSNLQVLCYKCNLSKSNKTDESAIE